MWDCATAATTDTVQRSNRGHSIRFPCIQINRKGRKIYICISNGKDHNTFTIDLTNTRFWTRSSCTTTEYLPGNVPTERPAVPLMSDSRCKATAVTTARMLRG